MKLLIKPENDFVKGMYENHGSFHDGDSGLDLFCPVQIECPPGQVTAIDFMIQCEPSNKKGYILAPRSSISKTPLMMANSIGVIDQAYRGNIIAMVRNMSNETYVIGVGTRLFQILAVCTDDISIEVVDELSKTTRGAGGFGSTGA